MQILLRTLQLFLLFVAAIPGVLAQLTPSHSGTIDRAFGTNGFAPILAGRGGAGVMTDNGVVFAATSENFAYPNTGLALSKQLPDGSLDTSFGQNGISRILFPRGVEPRSIAVQPDGRILVGGLIFPVSPANGWDLLLARFMPNGQLDNSFGGSGFVVRDIVPDTSNSSDYSFDTVGSIIVQDNGSVLISGTSDQRWTSTSQSCAKAILLRFLHDGTIDSSFGNGGISSTVLAINEGSILGNSPLRIKRLLNGKFIGGITVFRGQFGGTGYAQPAFVLRYQDNGMLDKSFGTSGIVDLTSGGPSSLNWNFNEIEELPDQKMLVLTGGAFNRLNIDGTFDVTFGDQGRLQVANGSLYTFTLLPDGSFIAAGSVRRSTAEGYKSVGELRRYSADGSPDVRFGVAGRAYINTPGYDTYLGTLKQNDDSKLMIMGTRNPENSWQFFRSIVFLKRKQ